MTNRHTGPCRPRTLRRIFGGDALERNTTTRAACDCEPQCIRGRHAIVVSPGARAWLGVTVRDAERAVRRWHERIGWLERWWDAYETDEDWERVVRGGPKGWRVELAGYWIYLRRRRAAAYHGKPYRQQSLNGLRKGI